MKLFGINFGLMFGHTPEGKRIVTFVVQLGG